MIGFETIAQIDTILNKIDTVVCTEFTSIYYFHTPYDTSTYNSDWYSLEADSAFMTGDSIVVNEQDTLLLLSIPKDTSQLAFLDTLFIRLHFKPIVDFEIPLIECYQNDTLIIKDNSIIYGDYTSFGYNQIGGAQLEAIDSLIKIIGTNGERIQIQINYSIEDCYNSIDTVLVGSKFQPQANFNSSEVCFGDTTLLFNNSQVDTTEYSFLLDVGGIGSFIVAQDTFKIYLPLNGDSREVFVEINQEDCIDTFVYSIKNNLLPSLNFQGTKTCENEFLKITNSSSDLTQDHLYSFSIFNKEYTSGQFDQYVLSDTFPNGIYDIIGVVDNQNGCSDSLILEVTIDSVTYVTFEGLEATYCELQDSSLLIGSISGGQFSGQFVSDFNNGSARFGPTSQASNIRITYTYENNLLCTDIDTQFVQFVYPKPFLELENLSNSYCLFDPLDTIKLNQNNQLTSRFEILKDGQFFDSLYTLNYLFNPDMVGVYEILNVYTDENGCFDSLLNTTTVNSLPSIALDSIIIIRPGEIITLGDDSAMEINVNYEWSNGSILSSIDVDQPGIYILEAIKTETNCMASDTVKVAFDPLIETKLADIQIGPNPTSDIVTISFSSFIQNIKLIDVFGESISLNGSKFFNTDNNGELILNLSNQSPGYYYLLVPDIGNFLIVKI